MNKGPHLFIFDLLECLCLLRSQDLSVKCPAREGSIVDIVEEVLG